MLPVIRPKPLLLSRIIFSNHIFNVIWNWESIQLWTKYMNGHNDILATIIWLQHFQTMKNWSWFKLSMVLFSESWHKNIGSSNGQALQKIRHCTWSHLLCVHQTRLSEVPTESSVTWSWWWSAFGIRLKYTKSYKMKMLLIFCFHFHSDARIIFNIIWKSEKRLDAQSTRNAWKSAYRPGCSITRGKMLGGCLSTNFMVYAHGFPAYFNSWAH